jgi:selenocysteine-specific elongation factor
VPGFGTVVTGTLTRGRLRPDQAVQLFPEGLEGRVRGLQVHGRPVAEAVAGQRVAVNLAGVDRQDLRRGQVLGVAGSVQTTDLTVLQVRLLAAAPVLKTRTRVHAHVGTAEAVARVRVLAGGEVRPGATGFVELRWEEAVAVGRGDAVLLRSYSPVTTIGGGPVVEVGVRHRVSEPGLAARLAAAARADPAAVLRQTLIDAAGPMRVDQAALAAGMPVGEARTLLDGDPGVVFIDRGTVAARATVERARRALLQLVEAYHRAHPARSGCPRDQVATAVPGWEGRSMAWLVATTEGLLTVGEVVRAAAFQPALSEREAAWTRAAVTALDAAGLAPPALDGLWERLGVPADRRRDLTNWLVHDGSLVPLDRDADLYVTAAAFRAGRMRVEEALRARGPLPTPALREVLGTSRKYAVPFLERLDEARVTRRVGDVRVLGAAS